MLTGASVIGVVGRWRRAGLLGAAIAMVAACSEGDDGTGDQGSTTTATTAATVRVVSQNLLHGIACPAETRRL